MAGAAAAAAAGDDGRRVKFLCSFGGQIIPRPSDGALRYAGGHTRIIAVRRDAPLGEIMRKMSAVLGGPAALRYQLPDVDLDALVSVSSPEDLDNMMEEYDKIAAANPDGSAKLRVFLFPPTESPDLLAFDDCGQRYVEAVNRISSDGRISSSSGMSPEILSPNAAAAHDPSRLFFVDANPPAVGSDATSLVELDLSPYSSQPYVDLKQFQYMNPQTVGAPIGSLPVSPVALAPHQYQYAPMVSQVGSEKSIPAKVEEKPYDGRAALLQGDASFKAPYQPVLPLPASYPQNVEGYGLQQAVPAKADSYLESNLYDGSFKAPYQPVLPLPASYPQNVEGYGLHQAVPPQTKGQPLDCFMCQKALPHAHSDSVVQDHDSVVSDASMVFHSLRPGDAMRLAPCRVMTGPMDAENLVPLGNFASRGFAQIPEIRHENQKLVVPNAQSPDHSKAMRPPAAMGLPSGTQALNGMYANIPQSGRQDFLQQQLQQPMVQSFGQPLHPVKKDGLGLGEPYGSSVYPVKNVNLQAPDPLNLVHAPEVPYNYDSQVNGKIEAPHVSPFDSSLYNEERKPTANLVISNQLKPENPPLAENKLPVKSQVGGNTISIGNAFSDPSIMPERTAIRPVDQLLPSLLAFTQSQNLQPSVPSQVPTQEALIFNHETGREPMAPTEWLHPLPVYSGSVNPGHNNKNINVAANGNWKDEAIWYPNNAVGNFASPPSTKSPFPFPDSSGTTQHMELFEQPILSNLQFSTQDPRVILGSMHLLPPRPTRVASKEPVISKDMFVDNLSISNQGPDLAALLDGGVFQQPSNSLIKESYRELPIRATKGLGEEQIDKELQAVAERAAALVLQSPVPATHLSVARDTKGTTSQSNQEARVTDDSTSSHNAAPLGEQRIETKQTDKLNPGFPMGDEIGRLQIIKNSDLEELRELGSGTFGTVYHGKWRGSDVAIKRINSRCFSGKPSEQERARVDFWNEASKLSDLHHPNVVAFYGVVVDGPGGSVATVTEYMVNGSLRQALHKNDKILDRSKRLVITMDVAFGMEYLHGKNIVHFDLKSDNLLVNLRDPLRPICKVGDLGLSKVKCQTLISGGVRGTLPWMAPELLNGSSNLVSEKVDVFSFGIVMWEILTGKEPYADMHYGAIIGGIVSNTLRPPVPESCEPDWRALMEKCWSSEPSERPSFTEIASSLRAMAAPSKGR